MAGSLIDLSNPVVPLPPLLIIDTNIAIDWLLARSSIRTIGAPSIGGQLRAVQLIERLQHEQTVGLVTSTSLNEVLHFVLKTHYRAELANFRADLVAQYPDRRRHSWKHLFKARSDLVTWFAHDLDRTCQFIGASGLLFLQPSDLGDIPSGRSLEDELIRTMARYQLDSSDAAIVIEASRAGVTAIATADRDLHRAHRDFDVYTWS